MQEQQRRNSTGTDFSVGDDSDLDSQNNQVSQYNFSYDGEEESVSQEGDNPYHLTQETKQAIKAKIEFDEIRCLKGDILRALKDYREARKQRGKQLSVRRLADIKRIHVLARNYNNYHTKEVFLKALANAVEQIRGGTLIFRRDKSSLKDALNEIIQTYSCSSSFKKKGLYITMCHYTKIQLSLEARAQERLPKSGLEDSLRRAPARISTPPVNNDESSESDIPQAFSENQRLKARLAELEEENSTLKNRLHVSRSGGGSGSGGDSKHSRTGKTPPNPEGISDSPTHSFEEGTSPRKGTSLKKMPPPAGVFGMSLNEDSKADIPSKGETGKKDAPAPGRNSLEDDRKKNKKLGKK